MNFVGIFWGGGLFCCEFSINTVKVFQGDFSPRRWGNLMIDWRSRCCLDRAGLDACIYRCELSFGF